MKISTWLLAALTIGCTASPAQMLNPGAVAPNLVGQTANGKDVRLSELKGSPAVVYFYPMDATPGCTKEACAFRDTFARYTEQGITIFGVSGDDRSSHDQFRQEHNLPFPLVADTEGRAMKAYGVDSTLGLASRVTFLVGPDGRIAHVWPDVDPGVHAEQVLQRIKFLMGATTPSAPKSNLAPK